MLPTRTIITYSKEFKRVIISRIKFNRILRIISIITKTKKKKKSIKSWPTAQINFVRNSPRHQGTLHFITAAAWFMECRRKVAHSVKHLK